MKCLFFLVALFLVGSYALTALETANLYNASDYKKDLLHTNDWIVTPGDNVSYMNLTTNPALAGHGVSLSLSILEPCGIILPHSHPRAAKTLFSITGEKLFVGFIQENKAKTIFNNLTIGQATFCPRGAIMFFQNLDCKPSMQLFSYGHEDPGLLSLAPNIFRMPDPVLRTAFNIHQNEVDALHSLIPGYPLDTDDECRRRCGLPVNHNTP